MAEPAKLPATVDFEASTPTPKPKAADHAPLVNALNDFLKQYAPPPSHVTRDVLNGRYRIDRTNPLPEFDTKTARAFAATDLMHSDKKLFALVCRQGTVQRHYALQALKGIEHPNLLTLCAAGPLALSQPEEERFVIFYLRPAGRKLSELRASTKGPISDTFITKNILGPIILAIGRLAELGIAHGGIRPDNIFFGDTPVLGDCLSEPCGFSQPYYFEPLDRMQTPPYAKGEGSVTQDYYALATLTLYMLYGQDHLASFSQEVLIRRVLREGAYAALLRNKEPPELFSDLLRGLLSGNINDRWNFRNLKQWIDGKRSNIMLPAAPAEALRPFEFAGTEANSRRELAYLFCQHWPLVTELMQTDRLMQWVLTSLRNKDLAETLKRIRANIVDTKKNNDIQISEQLLRLALLLDPFGPIRINTLCFHLDGLDSLCAELSANKAQADLRLLTKFIEHSMWSYWQEHQNTGPDYVMPISINNILLKLDRLRLFIRNTGYGFGTERMLYEFNPEMPCQSPLLANQYINTLPALLKQLDRLAPSLSRDQDPIDPHIAAFIANRLGILHEIKLPELIPHPSLATDRAILALRLISMAQDRCGDLALPGLSQWLAIRVLPSLDILRSKTLQERVKALLVERAKTGYTQYMAQVVIHSNYAIADVSGLGRAIQTYHHNIERMAFYRSEGTIDRYSTLLGYGMAKFLAYSAFILVLYMTWSFK